MQNLHDPYRDAYLASRAQRRLVEKRSLCGPMYSSDPPVKFLKLWTLLRETRKSVHAAPHPAVEAALQEFGNPTDWHLLALEYPQVATDGSRVAYVRNEGKREAHYNEPAGNKHLTATTVGKYLKRHWPSASDTAIRNLAARFSFEYKWITDLDEMVKAVQSNSADSCMKWDEDSVDRRGAHPYQVYDPKYGWKMAVVVRDGEYVGRALVLDDGKHKCFVRTYGDEDSKGRTQSHAGLEGWLESQGYNYEDEWPEGCKFAKVRNEYEGRYLAPYLDPGADRASSGARNVSDGGDHFYRDDDGEYEWSNTDGSMDRTCRSTCDNCGDRTDEDDLHWIEYEEQSVCECCLNNHYTRVQGRRGEHYYVRDSNAVTTVEGNSYDEDYLNDNDVVELDNGDCTHGNNAVYLEDEDCYFHVNDVASSPRDSGDVVWLEGGDYVLRKNAEWCLHSEEWIRSDDAVSVDGGYVHEDSHDDYICQLEREDVAKNCSPDELEEKLELWDETNGVHDTQVELPPEVTYAQQVQVEVAQATV